VPGWADTGVERYGRRDPGGSFTAERLPFVQGGNDFRPVGLAVAPDGSLFVSDWVLKDYTLHGRGAVWHVRPRDPHKPNRPADPRKALASLHRPLREAAARRLAADGAGRDVLRRHLKDADVRVRAAGLTALHAAGAARPGELYDAAARDPDVGLRALAARALAECNERVRWPPDNAPPALQLEAGL